jgi:hypothetical protein
VEYRYEGYAAGLQDCGLLLNCCLGVSIRKSNSSRSFAVNEQSPRIAMYRCIMLSSTCSVVVCGTLPVASCLLLGKCGLGFRSHFTSAQRTKRTFYDDEESAGATAGALPPPPSVRVSRYFGLDGRMTNRSEIL